MKKNWKKLAVLTLLGAQVATVSLTSYSVLAEESISAQSVDLSAETEAYKKFVSAEIDQLLKDSENFAKLIQDGKLDEAKKVYPLIRKAYERSEPIAELFAESDVKIDYRLADYVEDNQTEEGWSGFHKIEQILWEEGKTEPAVSYAKQLVDDIKELKAKVATVEVTPENMLTGAVDLLNEVATSKITGEEEIYSHTDLYDFEANIAGAEKIFSIFKDKISAKDPELAKNLTEKFKAVNDLLASHKVDADHYKLYTDLSEKETKALAEAVTKLGEPLSQMAVILEADESGR